MNFWRDMIQLGFPDDASVKESTCQCKRCKRRGFDSWVRKIPWKRSWQPTVVFLPGESGGQGCLTGYSPWGHTDSDMTWRDLACKAWFNPPQLLHLERMLPAWEFTPRKDNFCLVQGETPPRGEIQAKHKVIFTLNPYYCYNQGFSVTHCSGTWLVWYWFHKFFEILMDCKQYLILQKN